MSHTYLTTEELALRIKYNARTIRNALKDSVLLEGRHYIRPFGGRKILYIWEHIEQDMFCNESSVVPLVIPMSNGTQAVANPLRNPIPAMSGIAIPMRNGGVAHG